MKIKIILVILLLLSITAVIIYSSVKKDDIFMESIIESVSEETGNDVIINLENVRSLLDHLFIPGLQSFPEHPDSLCLHLSQKLGETKLISALLVFKDEILYLVYRDQDTWVSTSSTGLDSNNTVSWKRLDNTGLMMSEWSEILDTNRNLIKWIKRQHNENKAPGILWSDAYHSGFTQKAVMAMATKEYYGSAHDSLLLLFEIPLEAIRGTERSLSKYKNTGMFLLAGKGIIVPIPHQDDSLNSFVRQSISRDNTNVILDRAIDAWKTMGGKMNSPYIFSEDGQTWWNYVRPIQDLGNINGFGIYTTEESLKFGALRQYYILAVLLGLVLVLLIFSIYLNMRKRKRMAKGLNTVPETNIANLVKKGEGNFLEFKSSIRWDYRLEKVNPVLEDVIVKTVAAFNNGEGGRLIIGVDDDGNVLGLDNDFKSLKRHDEDYFELHLRNLLNKQFSISYTTENVTVMFKTVEEKVVCMLEIQKGTEPLFIITKDKNGNRKEKFFIRSGNSSQEITSLKEISDYINRRFQKAVS